MREIDKELLEKVKVERKIIEGKDTFWIHFENEVAVHTCDYSIFKFSYYEPYNIRAGEVFVSLFSYYIYWDSGAKPPEVLKYIIPYEDERKFILENWRHTSRNSLYSIPKFFANLFKEILLLFGDIDRDWHWERLVELILEDEYYDDYQRTYIKTKYYNPILDNQRKENLFTAIKFNFALASLVAEFKIRERVKEYVRCENCFRFVRNWISEFEWVGEKELKLLCKKCAEEVK
jgi:hypothetical protein